MVSTLKELCSKVQIRERSLTFLVVFWVYSDSETGPKLNMHCCGLDMKSPS